MKPKSKLSIFALQQSSSRPGVTIVFTVFTLGYLLYLIAIRVINTQTTWLNMWRFRFEDYFMNNNAMGMTSYLIRSEIVFLASLIVLVLVLSLAYVKVNKGIDTIKRLSISDRSVRLMQWLSDCAYTLGMWLAHLTVIILFYIFNVLYYHSDQMDLNRLYTIFACERYLYMLFPIMNPLSLVRMLSLVIAISFLPSLISGIIDNILEKTFSIRNLFAPILLIGLIGLSYFTPGHELSLIVCVIAMIVGVFCYEDHLQKEGV